MAECLFIMVVFFYSTIWGLFCHCPFLLDLFNDQLALFTFFLSPHISAILKHFRKNITDPLQCFKKRSTM